jgi:hypothetical protein
VIDLGYIPQFPAVYHLIGAVSGSRRLGYIPQFPAVYQCI